VQVEFIHAIDYIVTPYLEVPQKDLYRERPTRMLNVCRVGVPAPSRTVDAVLVCRGSQRCVEAAIESRSSP
jgi:hypothetical protein